MTVSKAHLSLLRIKRIMQEHAKSLPEPTIAQKAAAALDAVIDTLPSKNLLLQAASIECDMHRDNPIRLRIWIEQNDPKLEGRIPEQCAKLNCGKENRLKWFVPQEGQANFSSYKNSYCDKNFSYTKIEDDFVKELKDSNGAKICGKKVADFF